MKAKVCKICGDIFIVKKWNHKYCHKCSVLRSREQAKAWYRINREDQIKKKKKYYWNNKEMLSAKKRERRGSDKIETRKCARCEKEYIVSKYNRKTQKYCSSRCAVKSYRIRRKPYLQKRRKVFYEGKTNKKICPVCGLSFTDYSRMNTKRYCSTRCGKKKYNTIRQGNRNELHDNYIISKIIGKSSILKAKEIKQYPKLIEAKRANIKLKRAVIQIQT